MGDLEGNADGLLGLDVIGLESSGRVVGDIVGDFDGCCDVGLSVIGLASFGRVVGAIVGVFVGCWTGLKVMGLENGVIGAFVPWLLGDFDGGGCCDVGLSVVGGFS